MTKTELENLRKTYDLRVGKRKNYVTPKELRKFLPSSKDASKTVLQAREEIEAVLSGKSDKIIVPLGPCSIHSEHQALAYANELRYLKEKVKDTMILVMRTYFERQNIIVGWEGLINDPGVDKSCRVNEGFFKARNILLQINEMGIPCAMEMVSQLPAERLTDLLSLIHIGTGNSESHIHRRWASALSTPVGFENGSNGQSQSAINGILTASQGHNFPGDDENGISSNIPSKGNPFCYIVLRGGSERPNYDPVNIGRTIKAMENAELKPNIFIDCAQNNSGQKHTGQKYVFSNGLAQILEGNKNIKGLTFKSCLVSGRQENFIYGTTSFGNLNHLQSITNECTGWKETEELILTAHEMLLENKKTKGIAA